MIHIGIDPGKSGGIALCTPRGRSAVVTKMPSTERDVFDFVQPYGKKGSSAFALIEGVHSMPKQGVRSTFNFGMNYGALRMALVACGIPFEEISPSVWQREFGLIKKKGESNTQKKNRHKAKAQQLFPDITVTHALADALLIMEYNRRVRS